MKELSDTARKIRTLLRGTRTSCFSILFFPAMIILSCLFFGLYINSSSSKVSASSSGISLSATINPSATLSLSSQAVNLDIIPSVDGTFSSGYLTVSTYTNTSGNCAVTMTTSSSDLVSGESNTIASLSSATDEENFTNDSWGFRSGDTGDFNPIETTNTIASYNVNTGNSNALIKNVHFAAKLTAATKPGTYTNTVVFTSTCTPPLKDYMQDQTLATLSTLMPDEGDSAVLYDKRDGSDYTIKKINGQYWMTQNLRLTGTAVASLSNFTGTDFNVSQYSLASTDATYEGHCDETNGYNYPCSKDSGSTTTGVWYNYCSASAGTICGDSNNRLATQDICPAGWHLPTAPNITEGTDLNRLVGNTTSGWQDPTDGLEAFNAVAGGFYQNGLMYYTDYYGYWWSATANNNIGRYRLFYNTNNGNAQFDGNNYYGGRYFGFYIRCVKTDYMQEQTSESLASKMPSNGDSTTLYDKRDNNSYTVKKINGQYWMTQNLRVTGTIRASLSNFTGADFNVSQYSLSSSDGSYTDHCDVTNGYSYPCSKVSTNTSYGAWYNFCSASAGTICGDSNEALATQDICPSGWKLPTGPNTVSGRDFNILVGNTTAGWQDATNVLDIFSPVTGGYYGDGSSYNTGIVGYWWSATANSNTYRYTLYYNGNNTQFYGNNRNLRYYGFYVRCVRNS